MKARILLVSAATALMAAGASQAATSRHSASSYAEPAQPVPYSQLGAYMKASPKARASKDWSAGMNTASAATGMAADTSATTPATPAAPAAPAAQAPVNPPAQSMPAPAPADTSAGQPVNPPTAAPADSSATQPPASDSGSTAGPTATGGGATP